MKDIHPGWRGFPPTKASIWTNTAFAVIYAVIATIYGLFGNAVAAWVWGIGAVLWAGIVLNAIRWRRKTARAIAETRALQEQLEKENAAWIELVRGFHGDRQEP